MHIIPLEENLMENTTIENKKESPSRLKQSLWAIGLFALGLIAFVALGSVVKFLMFILYGHS